MRSFSTSSQINLLFSLEDAELMDLTVSNNINVDVKKITNSLGGFCLFRMSILEKTWNEFNAGK